MGFLRLAAQPWVVTVERRVLADHFVALSDDVVVRSHDLSLPPLNCLQVRRLSLLTLKCPWEAYVLASSGRYMLTLATFCRCHHAISKIPSILARVRYDSLTQKTKMCMSAIPEYSFSTDEPLKNMNAIIIS